MMGLHLLNAASPEEQVQLTRMLDKARRNVRRKTRRFERGGFVQVTPPLARKVPVGFFVHDLTDRNELRRRIEEAASGLLSEAAAGCLVVARHVDRWSEPYQVACLAKPAREKNEVSLL
ncbi:hypothetical protein [Sphingomonas sp.]|jgi:hypothetical protein|uniref:hypothetical protein n=1 Tax=Sphingomonas sp. TaxID=28214 RepID=UPI002DE6A7CA|nr:hypothetical protein [Sphingomonas sp.]